MATHIHIRTFMLLLLMPAAMLCRAQNAFYSHSTIYTNDSVRFTVYLDGHRINPTPQTRVRCINLGEPYYKLRVVFEDKSEPLERQRFYLRDTYGYPVAVEHLLKRSKKGRWKMVWKAQESWPGYAKQAPGSYPMPKPDASETPCAGKIPDAALFNAALESIRAGGTETAQRLMAKQVIRTNCVDVEQLKKVIALFPKEEIKLELALFAYPYTVDQGRYFQLNDVFKDPKNIEILYRDMGK